MDMKSFPIFYTTISAKELRPQMPAVPFLLSAASFLRQDRKGRSSLRRPRYLPTSHLCGADSGGFTAAMRWGGQYRFTWVQYLTWLRAWGPQWAAIPDLPCLSETGGDPGPEVVKERQAWTTKTAWHFWLLARETPWCWVPTITGYDLASYERHARALQRLIREMQAYYSDPAWGEEEDDEPPPFAFRVGIGSVCRRSAGFILDVIRRVLPIIGEDIALHLWGVKLNVLQSGLAFPNVISCDSGAWNGLFGREHDKRRASGLTVVEYSWQVKHPAYLCKIAQAQRRPEQLGLEWIDGVASESFPDPWQLVEQATDWY